MASPPASGRGRRVGAYASTASDRSDWHTGPDVCGHRAPRSTHTGNRSPASVCGGPGACGREALRARPWADLPSQKMDILFLDKNGHLRVYYRSAQKATITKGYPTPEVPMG